MYFQVNFLKSVPLLAGLLSAALLAGKTRLFETWKQTGAELLNLSGANPSGQGVHDWKFADSMPIGPIAIPIMGGQGLRPARRRCKPATPCWSCRPRALTR